MISCIFSEKIKKRALCAYDDKRYLLADGISTLAFGHKAIPSAVRAVQEARGNDQVVLTAAEVPTRQLALRKQVFAIGQDPEACMTEARRRAHGSTQATHQATPQQLLNVIDMDPDGPHALTQDQLIDFIFDY